MKLELTNELNEIKNDLLENTLNTLEQSLEESELENLKLDSSEINLSNELDKRDLSKDTEKNKEGIDKTIKDLVVTLEENIALEVDKLNLNESFWNKITKSDFADVVKVGIESVLKSVLKKKFKIDYSTFNEAKKALNDALDGNTKDMVKNVVDSVINELPFFDNTTKTVIKNVKNAIIDKTIDSEKYKIVNKQTKLLNRISNNCEKFDKAMEINDEKQMKSTINSIRKDMKSILPIRETISKAQGVLDKYSLWENKGKQMLTKEEGELVDKLNACA